MSSPIMLPFHAEASATVVRAPQNAYLDEVEEDNNKEEEI